MESIECPKLLFSGRSKEGRCTEKQLLLSLKGRDWMLGLHLNLEECVG